MARKRLPKDVETEVLVRSRRRCCICFGLDRNTALKSGQIAHLDGDRDNNRIDNLAFLCLDHHDEYDSRTSQRKGLTINEVKKYRDELTRTVSRAFTQRVHFGEITTPPADPYAGQYVRLEGGDSAEITVTPLPDSPEGLAQYFVQGTALWGAKREYGPNLGFLEFVGTIEDDGTLVLRRSTYEGGVHITKLLFLGDGILEVREDNWTGSYGMNVNFIGIYRRGSSKS
jgi:hypothetical protein